MKRAVLTVATGNPAYWGMAMQLARSFEYWNRENDIGFFVLTDLYEKAPSSVMRLRRISVPGGSLGTGFSAKLYLDRFAPAEQTLFVDADCLCIRPLTFVFDRFAGRSVSVVGGTIAEGEWFGDVARTCRQTQVGQLPKFNGGIYYVEPGAKASAVYERARQLVSQYDALGLVRLRNAPNDELLMAIAMAQEDCWGIPEDGSVIGDFLSTPRVIALDAVRGRCVLENPGPPNPQHRAWFPLAQVRPAIVHFLGHHISSWLYRAEVLRLRLAVDYGAPTFIASAAGSLFRFPHQIADRAKYALRPMFHVIHGPRKVRPGVR